MRFELDKTLIDDILFHMENQDGNFVFDSQAGCVVDIHNNDDERYIPLPGWSSNDGYRLMEKFAANLKNPIVRKELSDALNRNKGVFRAYRDVLEEYPETEKLWFQFKEQKMKNEVIGWYNALREEWGLEPIGAEPEDNGVLVQEDFLIKEQEAEQKGICFAAEAADGDFAGNISSRIDGAVLHIHTLEIKSEYRGMGIGKTLLTKLLEKADEQKLDVTIDLPVETDFFARSLLLENFKPCMQRFIRKK